MSVDERGGATGPAVIKADQSPRQRLRAIIMGLTGRAAVPPDHVGIVRRRFGAADADFSEVSPRDQRGWQARTLRPGQVTWLSPARYAVEVVPRVHVPEGMIGLVTAKEGRQRPKSRRLGRYVECDNFQDGQTFLRNGGEQGRQVATLAGGHSYYINTRLFDVEFAARTYVPVGTIGLVIALDGKVGEPGRRFARHVECDNFQDGQAFLDAGGEQGRQLAVLAGGTSYDINPALFAVITTASIDKTVTQDGLTTAHLQEFVIPSGYAGVVVTMDGAAPGLTATAGPRVEGHLGFRLPWVFLHGGGREGVQEETLSAGSIWALNPWFARVVLIPTKPLILEWSKSPAEKPGNYDAALGQITLTIQGYQVHVELSQTLRIPEEAAPRLVSAFGDDTGGAPLGGLVNDRAPVQRFVEQVLGATVTGYLSGMAASSSVQEFLGRYNDARRELADKVRAELEAWGVESGSTNLGGFEVADPRLNEDLQAAANAEARGKILELEEQNAETQARIAVALLQSKLMEADPHLWSQVGALGKEAVFRLRIAEELVKIKVPQFVGSGADLMALFPMQSFLRELIGEQEQRLDRPLLDPGQDPDAEAIGTAALKLLPKRVDEMPQPESRSGYPTSVTVALPVSIYLADEAIHAQVETAVERWLAMATITIEEREQPIIGSWFRRMRATVKVALNSEAAHDLTLTAVHVADAHVVLAQDANITATLLSGLAPVIASLQPTKDAALRVGALLIVKVDWAVQVIQLTAAQQAVLDHQPELASAPHQIVVALATAAPNGRAHDVSSGPELIPGPRPKQDWPVSIERPPSEETR
jgi:hypothetical protein